MILPMRWVSFLVAMISSIYVLVIGPLALTVKTREWDYAFTICYGVWVVFFSAFVVSFLLESRDRILTGIYYLSAALIFFALSCLAGTFDPQTLPIIVPITSTVGTFFAEALRHILSSWNEHTLPFFNADTPQQVALQTLAPVWLRQ